MFEWFKRSVAPEGPVAIERAATIACAAEELYALLDWADPRNAKRALGNLVEADPLDPDHFVAVIHQMPDLRFDVVVTHAEPHRRYAFDCVIDPLQGRLLTSHEDYRIEPRGEDACTLTLLLTAHLRPGLPARIYEQEFTMLSMAHDNAMAKLKLHAEHGLEVVREMERQQFG